MVLSSRSLKNSFPEPALSLPSWVTPTKSIDLSDLLKGALNPTELG